jgi:hypothetical protein
VTTETDPEGNEESGGALREQLEASLADNKALREALATTVVKDFKYVSAEDLAQVAPNELQDRASELEAERIAERRSVVTDELKAKGWDEKQIEEFLGDNQGAPPPPKPKVDPSAGGPPARQKPGEGDGLYGPSRIRAALGD